MVVTHHIVLSTSPLSYLSVKWIIMQKVRAVKLLAVSLIQCYHIFPSFEYLNLSTSNLQYRRGSKLYNLISNIESTPNKVPLPFDGDHSSRVFNVHSIIFVSISKDYVRNPNRAHLVRFLLFSIYHYLISIYSYLRVR